MQHITHEFTNVGENVGETLALVKTRKPLMHLALFSVFAQKWHSALKGGS